MEPVFRSKKIWVKLSDVSQHSRGKDLRRAGAWMSVGGGMSDDDAATPEVFHETVFFSGRVQGVGFRYQVLQIAKGFEVAGYVQNLPDGRVILEAEGEEKEVAAFTNEVEEEMDGYIKHVEKRGDSRKQKFFGFTIR